MEITRINENLVELAGGAFRIEASPLRKKAKATEELLDDRVTASHYRVGETDADGKPIVRVDAMGKPIELGKDMNYIDWKNPDRCHVVYENVNGRFERVGEHPDYETALGAAIALANAEK